MVNMANALSKDYQVDLFIYNPEGPMKDRLLENVRVLPTSWRFRALGMSLGAAFRSGDVRIIWFRVFAAVWTKAVNNKLPIQLAIKHQKKLAGYDLAIAYHQEQRKKSTVSGFSRVVDQCVEAKKKAAWLHYDSATIDLDSAYNRPVYEKMDKIVCVSRSLMENFAVQNPTLSEKMDYCYNFMDYEALIQKSKQEQVRPYPQNAFSCFSACRLTQEKALPRAIRALSSVFKDYPDLVWYIAGDGVERENIETAIRECGLTEQIILIGNQSNPYPYMKNADLVMNVSYHEAAPMVYFEAMALQVPVFATKTSSSEELLKKDENAFICENSEAGLAAAFRDLTEKRDAVYAAKENLKVYVGSNDMSSNKIATFLEIG